MIQTPTSEVRPEIMSGKDWVLIGQHHQDQSQEDNATSPSSLTLSGPGREEQGGGTCHATVADLSADSPYRGTGHGLGMPVGGQVSWVPSLKHTVPWLVSHL